MKTQDTTSIEEYRRQIRECARHLAVAKNDVVTPYLPSDDVAEMVDIFTEGNLDKRIWKLTDQFEFMKEEFENLETWFQTYIHEVPLKAYDVGTTDSIEFLRWVRGREKLTDRQGDFFTCHESRVAVEESAREKRMAHVGFQDRLSISEQLQSELESNAELWLHLNPVRVWATFKTTALLDEEDDVPAKVIFYPHGGDIRTAVFEDDGAKLIEQIANLSPCRLDVLQAVAFDWSREDLIDTVRDLVALGLVAIG